MRFIVNLRRRHGSLVFLPSDDNSVCRIGDLCSFALLRQRRRTFCLIDLRGIVGFRMPRALVPLPHRQHLGRITCGSPSKSMAWEAGDERRRLRRAGGTARADDRGGGGADGARAAARVRGGGGAARGGALSACCCRARSAGRSWRRRISCARSRRSPRPTPAPPGAWRRPAAAPPPRPISTRRRAREIFGPRDAVLAWGPPNRSGRARPVDGGYRLNGTWQFASGSRHATWLGAHAARRRRRRQARPGAAGRPTEPTLLFPRAAATITDTWQVIGLKATGSDTYAVEDLFVPATPRAAARRGRDAARGGAALPLHQFPALWRGLRRRGAGHRAQRAGCLRRAGAREDAVSRHVRAARQQRDSAPGGGVRGAIARGAALPARYAARGL